MQNHIREVHACLAVTFHLHFWQNDRDLLRATAVTRGRNGYRNKRQHTKLTPKKKILPPLPCRGLNNFQSRVQGSNHWDIPAPYVEAELWWEQQRSSKLVSSWRTWTHHCNFCNNWDYASVCSFCCWLCAWVRGHALDADVDSFTTFLSRNILWS